MATLDKLSPISGASATTFVTTTVDEIPKTLEELLKPSPFAISAKRAQDFCKYTNITTEQLLQDLIVHGKAYAIPPISNYKVAVAGVCESGNIYLGVNLEFPGTQLQNSVHAEQFFLVNIRNHNEKKIVSLALSAPPCGFCRQCLREIGQNNGMLFLAPEKPPMTLNELLPHSFGPENIFSAEHCKTMAKILEPADRSSRTNPAKTVGERAIQAASESYAPYTNHFSGVAIETDDGKIYSGSHIENAAYNPTISPFQAALVDLLVHGKSYSDISTMVLAQTTKSSLNHNQSTMEIWNSIVGPTKIFSSIVYNR
jgi:cytidine deaminase